MIKILLILISFTLLSCGGSSGGGGGDDSNSNITVSVNYKDPSNTNITFKKVEKKSISLVFPEATCTVNNNGSISSKNSIRELAVYQGATVHKQKETISSNDYTINELTEDTSYNFHFKISCSEGDSSAVIEKTSSTTTLKATLKAYSAKITDKNIVLRKLDDKSFEMGWVEARCLKDEINVGEHYQVKSCIKDSNICTENSTTNALFTQTGLTAETVYSFDVTAVCNDDNSVSASYTTKYITTEATPDATVPTITSGNIFNDAAIDDTVVVTFSEAVTSCNFTLKSGGDVAFAKVWSLSNDSVTITPNSDLTNNKQYELSVSACSDGTNVMVNKTIYVNTIKFPAQIAPTVSVNDTTNIFQWTVFGSFVNSDFEYSLNSGTDWTVATNNSINVGNNEYAVGKICARVKTSITQSTSTKACNAQIFTGVREKILGSPVGVTGQTFLRTMNFRFLDALGENLTITSLKITELDCYAADNDVIGTIKHIKSNGDVIDVFTANFETLSPCLGGDVSFSVNKSITVFAGDKVVLSTYAPSSFPSGNFDATKHEVSMENSW